MKNIGGVKFGDDSKTVVRWAPGRGRSLGMVWRIRMVEWKESGDDNI